MGAIAAGERACARSAPDAHALSFPRGRQFTHVAGPAEGHEHAPCIVACLSDVETTRAYLQHYGKPAAFYSDKTNVIRSTRAWKTGADIGMWL